MNSIAAAVGLCLATGYYAALSLLGVALPFILIAWVLS